MKLANKVYAEKKVAKVKVLRGHSERHFNASTVIKLSYL